MILIWKANIEKNKTRDSLAPTAGDFAAAVKQITVALHNAQEPKAKLAILMSPPWRFRLATATAILTVLYPVEFTVYDARVCDELTEFQGLGEKSFSNGMWEQYQHFKKAVEESTPSELCLRHKDRYLWGKSFYNAAVKASADAPRDTDRSISVGEHRTRAVIRQQIYDVASTKLSSGVFLQKDQHVK
jgi:hypothetical protein